MVRYRVALSGSAFGGNPDFVQGMMSLKGLIYTKAESKETPYDTLVSVRSENAAPSNLCSPPWVLNAKDEK